MTTLKRNRVPFYYCLYEDKGPIKDEYGNDTGEEFVTYSEPEIMFANISPATGMSNTEQFGNLENYDKVIVTADMSCPIDENSVLFIDKDPDYANIVVGYQESDTLLGDDEPIIVALPKYDYIVRRVAKSLNSISIAVRKVNVS